MVYILEYVLEVLLDNNIFDIIEPLIKNSTGKTIISALKSGDLDAKSIIKLLDQILELTDSPTLVYWTFAQYLQEMTENF